MLIFAGCSDIGRDNPYEQRLQTLRVEASYPEGYAEYMREGVTIRIENVDLGYTYRMETDTSGAAVFAVANGIYRVTLSDRIDGNVFNGTADRVKVVDDNIDLALPLVHSKAGTIVFKEIYCGGCTKTPQQGTYQADRYVILHNNDSEMQYLDGLCFGTLDPYNSQGTNVWVTQDASGASVFPDFAPIIQCVWQFGGDGEAFPLAPGEDAVVALCGAIDHASQYPLSVNLNKEGYFVCYNNVYFPNTQYHPAPGSNITTDRYLNVVIKTGQANAYTLSVSSPTAVIFRAQDTTIQNFILEDGSVVQKPGSTVDQVVKIPLEWIIDGVEVFDGRSSNNKKRLSPAVDAGYVTQTDIFLGRTLYRHVDEEASEAVGYEVLADTNNSSTDFYERTQQSLHD